MEGPPANAAKASSLLPALRTRLQAALQVHLQHSSPEVPPLDLSGGSPTRRRLLAAAGPGAMDEDGGEGEQLDAADDGNDDGSAAAIAIPQWSLQCDRQNLAHLVACYVAGPEAELARLQGAAAISEEHLLMLRHEGEAWRLVQALWGYIEGEDDGGAADGDDDGASDGAGFIGGQAALAGFKRRRAVGQWLQQQAKGLAETELESVSEPCEAVLRLLCAHQPAAAAAIAVAAGDVRLATLVAQVGGGSGGSGGSAWGISAGMAREAEEQLAVWTRNDMLGHVSRDRLLCYRLLAGQVS